MIWNMKQFDYEWMAPFYEQRKQVVKKVGGSMKYLVNSMEWKKDIDAFPGFKLKWSKSLAGTSFQGDLESILSNLTTVSAYNALTAEERTACIDQLRQIVKNWPGIDINNISIPYTTELYVYSAQ